VAVVDYARSLIRGWVILLVGLVIVGAVGFGLAHLATPQYTASTQLLVVTPTTDLNTAASSSQLAIDRATAYAQLLTGQQLARNVATALSLDVPPGQVAQEITATVVAGTPLIDVTVQDTSPRRAYDIANALGPQLSNLVNQLQGTGPGTPSVVGITVAAFPQQPTSPSSPNTTLFVIIGLAVGFVLAAITAVVRDRLDTRVRSEEDASAAAAAPILGLVPRTTMMAKNPVAAAHDRSVAESFQMVETNLRFESVDLTPGALLFTSPERWEGRTTTAINLARAAADSGRRVLLVDADLHHPCVTRYLGLESQVGLAQVLAGEVAVDDALQTLPGRPLSVLGAGPQTAGTTQLLSGPSMSKLLPELVAQYDLVILDGPPLLQAADAAVLASLCGAVVVCARWKATGAKQLARSREVLDRARARTLGLVLTLVTVRRGPLGFGRSHGRLR
jgi:polysaccharide biosynthesis transport protein